MRWMMYRWWCEGRGDRAWWVIESVFLCLPDKGFSACLGDLPPDMPRRPETWVLLCNLMLQLHGIDVPRVTMDNSLWVTPFIPRERLVKHVIAGYLRLPRPTPASALMRVLNWLRCWAEEPGYATSNPPENYGQIRRCCSCPWMIVRLVLLYNAVHRIQQTEKISNDPSWMGAKNTTIVTYFLYVNHVFESLRFIDRVFKPITWKIVPHMNPGRIFFTWNWKTRKTRISQDNSVTS